jgi:hypothetical protein
MKKADSQPKVPPPTSLHNKRKHLFVLFDFFAGKQYPMQSGKE